MWRVGSYTVLVTGRHTPNTLNRAGASVGDTADNIHCASGFLQAASAYDYTRCSHSPVTTLPCTKGDKLAADRLFGKSAWDWEFNGYSTSKISLQSYHKKGAYRLD